MVSHGRDLFLQEQGALPAALLFPKRLLERGHALAVFKLPACEALDDDHGLEICDINRLGFLGCIRGAPGLTRARPFAALLAGKCLELRVSEYFKHPCFGRLGSNQIKRIARKRDVRMRTLLAD